MKSSKSPFVGAQGLKITPGMLKAHLVLAKSSFDVKVLGLDS
jgi:hypothetical protein